MKFLGLLGRGDLSVKQIAMRIGVSAAAIYKAKNTDEAFATAWEAAYARGGRAPEEAPGTALQVSADEQPVARDGHRPRLATSMRDVIEALERYRAKIDRAIESLKALSEEARP